MNQYAELAKQKWSIAQQLPWMKLVHLFTLRMFRGGDSDSNEIGATVGAILVLLAMPGVLVSLLLLDEYGSLVRFLQGKGAFDPFVAPIPDEYFFIVLSMAVCGAILIWRWDALFPDQRDYQNLVHLPIPIGRIFLANLTSIVVFTVTVIVVINIASAILFPVAVLGSEGTAQDFFQFAFGHAVTMFATSFFAALAVFAVLGTLLSILPYRAFRPVSLVVKFFLALVFLVLLATSGTVPAILDRKDYAGSLVDFFPSVWMLGLAQTLWHRHGSLFISEMTWRAASVSAVLLLLSAATYWLGFRKSFLRIPEIAERGLISSRQSHAGFIFTRIGAMGASNAVRACNRFVIQTLFRSASHVQLMLTAVALSLIAVAKLTDNVYAAHTAAQMTAARNALFSIPFIVGFLFAASLRVAFEIPVDIRANWTFRFWLDPTKQESRSIARRIMYMLCLPWLLPLTAIYAIWLWGWIDGLLHLLFSGTCMLLLIEVLILKYRKVPFTCAFPTYKSRSPLVLALYVLGFVFFGSYLPALEASALAERWDMLWFVPVLGAIYVGLRTFRKEMLQMDKLVIFEEGDGI